MHSALSGGDSTDGRALPPADGPAVPPLSRPLRTLLVPALRQGTEQIDFGVRRFHLRLGPAREVLEAAGQAFLAGFHAVLRLDSRVGLAEQVDELPPESRGFAFEGAGMACCLLDLLTGTRGRRFGALLAGPGARYRHLAHVGAGWAYARLRMRPRHGTAAGRPPEPWLGWDGFGFHQAFFHADRTVGEQHVQRGLTPHQLAAQDQGVGRALWFHECADPAGVALRIQEFPRLRHGDLWSGIGLAATYAGGATEEELVTLARGAGVYRPHLAQGTAFACKAHQTSGHVPVHTERAAPVLAGVPVESAAAWTDRALDALGPAPRDLSHYQRWRAQTRALYLRDDRGGPEAP